MKRRTLLAGSAAAAAASTLPVFAQGRKLKVAFANFNDEASFGASVLRGMQAAARARTDMDVSFFDNKQDGARTVEIARAVALQKPDVFIEYSFTPTANPQVARIMSEAGVSVIAVQQRIGNAPLFAVDNPLAGYGGSKPLSEEAKKRWPGQTPVALVLSWPEAGPVILERAAAARKGFEEVFPGIRVEEQSTKGDPINSRAVMTDFLTKFPGRKVIVWSHVDGMSMAALTAARNANREADVLIASTGGETVVFPEIRKLNGGFFGTFSFFPESWGSELLTLAARMGAKETLPETIRPSKQLLITASNINQHYPER